MHDITAFCCHASGDVWFLFHFTLHTRCSFLYRLHHYSLECRLVPHSFVSNAGHVSVPYILFTIPPPTSSQPIPPNTFPAPLPLPLPQDQHTPIVQSRCSLACRLVAKLSVSIAGHVSFPYMGDNHIPNFESSYGPQCPSCPPSASPPSPYSN